MITFRIHIQAVGFTAVVSRHVVVADGDVEGVAPRDVVTQRLPIDSDQPRPGLCDLQPLWGPHWFYRKKAKGEISFIFRRNQFK